LISLKFGNYSAPTGLLIIAWGNAPGAGVYEVKALKGRIKIKSKIKVPRALPWALIKRPFRAFKLHKIKVERAQPWALIKRPFRAE